MRHIHGHPSACCCRFYFLRRRRQQAGTAGAAFETLNSTSLSYRQTDLEGERLRSGLLSEKGKQMSCPEGKEQHPAWRQASGPAPLPLMTPTRPVPAMLGGNKSSRHLRSRVCATHPLSIPHQKYPHGHPARFTNTHRDGTVRGVIGGSQREFVFFWALAAIPLLTG